MKKNKKWKNIKKVFLTDTKEDIEEKQRDYKIMAVTIAVITLTCIWIVIQNYRTKTEPLLWFITSLLDIVFIMCGLAVYLRPRTRKIVQLAKFVSSITICIIFTLYAVKGYNQGFSLLWALIVPYGSMTVIGLLPGTVVTAYLSVMNFVLFWTPLRQYLLYEYSDVYCSRFPVLFVLASVISLYTNYKLAEANLHQAWEKERLQAAVEEERRKIGKITMQTIISISNAVDAKDSYTKKHSERVAKYSKIIANELRWSKTEQENLYNMALLHDIGKIGVPDAILNKHGMLTDEEYPTIRKHPIIGGEILKDFTLIEDVSVGAYYHHERYDGKGYPQGLKGEEIPIEARIIGIADSIDAMNSDRVYRGKKDISYILNQLEAGKGTQFDPNLDEIVIALIKKGKLRLDR